MAVERARKSVAAAAGAASRAVGDATFLIRKIKFAPLRVPFKRRRQTFCLLVHILSQIGCLMAAFVLLLTPLGWVFLVPYGAWMVFFQTHHHTGGFPQEWLRRSQFYRHVADYFPCSLERTVELDPKKTYIFGYHPHGIIGFGAQLCFGTDACGFSSCFPGISCSLLTLSVNFRIPFFAQLLGALGICDASKQTILNVLGKGAGHSVCLVLGGAKESLDARPGNYELTLKNRKGFVKMALRTGASLVPAFGFGENDLFDQVSPESAPWLRRLQLRMQKQMGFAVPLFFGRGIFNYSLGLLPQRRPIHVVVGKPIDVPQAVGEPLPAEIDKYHQLYVQELSRVFKSFQKKYCAHPDGRIVLK